MERGRREVKHMSGPWDTKMKRLFGLNPQEFVTWLTNNEAQFVNIVSSELHGENLYADSLLAVTIGGKQALLHIEFQSSRDSVMAERLWEYNMRATLQYRCPVWSVVIYLKKDATIQAPLTREFPNGRRIHLFDFDVIRLWEIKTQTLLEHDLHALLPLLPLTHEGARREVIEEAIAILAPEGKEPEGDLLTLTYGFASLVFESQDDQNWLSRRFHVLYNILMNTPAYQELTRESREEALEEGRQALRQALLGMVAARFPSTTITLLTEGRINITKDLQALQHLIVKIGTAQSEEEAKYYLLEGVETKETVPGVTD